MNDQTLAAATLGADIRALRKARGLTLSDIAAVLNRSVGWLSQVERDMSDPSISDLRQIAEALGVPVRFSDVCAGPSAAILTEQLAEGEVLLCENLRYQPGETANDPAFAAQLAQLGDLYVNDAFSCAHRAHASTEAITRCLPAYAGPLLLEEIAALGAALESPARPSVAIVGGAKVSTKIAVLKHLAARVDHLVHIALDQTLAHRVLQLHRVMRHRRALGDLREQDHPALRAC